MTQRHDRPLLPPPGRQAAILRRQIASPWCGSPPTRLGSASAAANGPPWSSGRSAASPRSRRCPGTSPPTTPGGPPSGTDPCPSRSPRRCTPPSRRSTPGIVTSRSTASANGGITASIRALSSRDQPLQGLQVTHQQPQQEAVMLRDLSPQRHPQVRATSAAAAGGPDPANRSGSSWPAIRARIIARPGDAQHVAWPPSPA